MAIQTPAFAQSDAIREVNVPAGPASRGIAELGRQADLQILAPKADLVGAQTNAVRGRMSGREAVRQLLQGTSLRVVSESRGVIAIRSVPQAATAANVDKIAAVGAPPPAPASRTILQAAPAAAAADGAAAVEAVVVTASRITAIGFSAPTPTTVVSAADILQSAQPNLFDTIAQLPSLQGSVGTQSNAGNFSTGANGLSSFNLRGLGTIRSLTLIDGQRVVPAYVTGIADVSQFPQLLIQRVDVVNGGASASWGSDAIGGVINFVTDKTFTGLKGNVLAGISRYDDYKHGSIQLAAGKALFGGKAHITVAGEYYDNDGVAAPNLPNGELTNGRCCNLKTGTLSYTTANTPVGAPQFTSIYGAQNNVASVYGLISGGPLRGVAFDVNGTPTQFQYGAPCVATLCVGGDLSNSVQKTTVDNPLKRAVFYARLSYRLTQDIQLYSTFNYGKVTTFLNPPQGNRTGLTIQCGNAAGGPNAYLPASINAACIANNITNFPIGVSYDKFPPTSMDTVREQRRYVVGAEGSFNLLGRNWLFDAYYQHGENQTSIHVRDIFLNARYNAAADAVAGPNGTVQCRSAVARASGCVPFPVFGGAAISPAAFEYMNAPVNGPYSYTDFRQEAASLSVNGAVFRNWAGDVALAIGAEFREEAYATRSDPYGDGVSPGNPNTPAYPADPLLDAVNGNNWFAANFHRGSGTYHVYEAFAETRIPLVDTPQLGEASVTLAGRVMEYSTSGYVDTWKVGMTWATPLNGVRLRGLRSRDVRAPNLSELFAAPITTNNGVINRLLPPTAPTVNILNIAIGNPDLQPEAAATTELGAVFQPSFLPGFALSVDWYRIRLRNQIGALTNQQEIDLCQLYGNNSFCSKFFLGGVQGTSNPSYVIVQPFNLAQTITSGIDIEASYRFDLQHWNIPGRFVLRGLANHVIDYTVNTGVPGQPIADFVGAQISASPAASRFQAGVPTWKVFLTQSWSSGKVTFNITERYFSDTVFDPNGIVCQAPSCPVPTAQNPTYSSMDVPGYVFVDVGGSYDVSDRLQAYFRVANVADSLPKPFALLNSDPIGRVYRVGLRFNY